MTLVKILIFCIACLGASMLLIERTEAQWDHCQDSEGQSYLIPINLKPILVPMWLDPERLIIETHVARKLEPEQVDIQPVKCDDGELVVSPAVCEE